MAEMVKVVCPVAYEAFVDYQLEAVSFSGPELRMLKPYLDDFSLDLDALAKGGLSKREAQEFLDEIRLIKKLNIDEFMYVIRVASGVW
jgi:predicted component of viral defense system (DUF524 family)